MATTKWCLLGFADDEGVKNVGGRIGAAKGPRTFREFFYKLNPRNDVISDMTDLEDAVFRIDELEEKHSDAIEAVQQNHPLYDFSIVVGGGHDYSYCHLKGIKNALPKKKIGCINIDPHFDMRKPDPDITSGSPFYLALEEGIIKGRDMVCYGIQPHSNGPALWDFAKKHKVKVIEFNKMRFGKSSTRFKEALRDLAERVDVIVLSVDLDSLSAPFAPGVSAPAVEGFTPSDIMEMIGIASVERKVRSLGIFELNPNYDQDNRTARLAAAIAYYFAAGKIC